MNSNYHEHLSYHHSLMILFIKPQNEQEENRSRDGKVIINHVGLPRERLLKRVVCLTDYTLVIEHILRGLFA